MKGCLTDLEHFGSVKQSVSPTELVELIDNIDGLYASFEWGSSPKDVVQINVSTPLGEGFNYTFRTYALPKTEKRTLEYYSKKLMQTVNRLGFGSKWVNMTNFFKDNLKLNQSYFYYTSFGFSIVCAGLTSRIFTDTVNAFKSQLDGAGIEYKNEYSGAYWVYRFRFSQKKENIKKIEKFLETA